MKQVKTATNLSVLSRMLNVMSLGNFMDVVNDEDVKSDFKRDLLNKITELWVLATDTDKLRLIYMLNLLKIDYKDCEVVNTFGEMIQTCDK